MTVPALSGSVSPTMDRVGGGPKSAALGIKLGITSLLRMPLTGVPSSVLNFAVTVTGEVRHKGRRRGYIETSLCPPGAQVPLLGNFTFRDGVVKSDKTTIVCGGVLP